MDVRLPNGVVIQGIPEGTSKEDIQRKAISAGYATQADFSIPAPVPAPVDYTQRLAQQTGPLDAALIGAGRGFTQLGRGISDFLGFEHTPDPGEEAGYAALQQARPLATGLGEAAPYMAGGAGTGAALRGAGLLANLAGQAGTGAVLGGAKYAPTGTQRLANAATEGLLSAGGELAGQGVSRLLAPHFRRSPVDTARARELGYNVLPSTEAVSARNFRQTIEGGMESLPGSSAVLNRALAENQETFNRAAAEAIGEQADDVTDTVLANARRRIGGEFDRLMPENFQIPVDDELLERFIRIDNETVAPFIAGPADPVRRTLDRAYEVLGRDTISAAELMRQQSRLGKQARQAMRGENANPDLGHALFDMQEALLDAAQRNMTPDDLQAFRTAREQYRNLMTLESGANVDPVTGNVSAARIASFLQRRDRAGFLEGGNRSPFYEGARFLGRAQPRLPSSGTAERMFLQNAMLGGILGGGAAGFGSADPLTGAALGAGTMVGLPYAGARAYLSRPMSQWMHRAMSPVEEQAIRAIGQSVPRGILGPD